MPFTVGTVTRGIEVQDTPGAPVKMVVTRATKFAHFENEAEAIAERDRRLANGELAFYRETL